jgi:TolA-binding protein
VRVRFLVMLLIMLSWAWLFLQQQRPGNDGAAADTATASTMEVISSDSQSVEADLAGLPRDSARRLYDRIMEEFHRKDCQAAEAGFRMFVVIHQGSPLIPYAEYWRGECAFREGRYQQAIDAFDRTVSRSPLPPRLAAAAFMRKGVAYAKLGKLNRSRNVLELVVVQFPNTEQAILARKALLTR